jgi:gp16 family phage-associated protein
LQGEFISPNIQITDKTLYINSGGKYTMSSTKQTVLSGDEVKARFRAKGISIAEWARDNGYNKDRVYRILNGFEACTRGKSHEIAVKLGLKADPEKVAELH